MLCQGDTFNTDSVQYLFDRDKKPNILKTGKFSDSITAKIVRAGNRRYLTNKVDRKRNLFVQLKNTTKQIEVFQLFEKNRRNLFYTNETLTNYKPAMNWYGKAWLWSKKNKKSTMTVARLDHNLK